MVKKILLTQGQHALVDDEDFDFLNQFGWYACYNKSISNFYAQRSHYLRDIRGKRKLKMIMMHRLIMERIVCRKLQRNELIDHINHDPLDNRRENLRIATNRQNMQNMTRKTTSKYPGVSWVKDGCKWRAEIWMNGKSKYLGIFKDEREAAKAYERACRELCGEELVCKAHKVKGEI